MLPHLVFARMRERLFKCGKMIGHNVHAEQSVDGHIGILLRKWAIWSTVILNNGIKKGIPVLSLYRT